MLVRRRIVQRAAAAASVAVAAGAASLSGDTETSVARTARTLWHSAIVALDYKYGPASKLLPGSTEYKEAQAATHQRSADRLLQVCLLHGGLYVKLGQFVASMNHILPAQYPATLAACQDRARPVDYETVRFAVERELGRPLDEVFSSFDAEPIAAASLAQVHRATTADGRCVACKVQYPQLQTQVDADMRTMRVLAACVGRLFPGHEYGWLIPEFEQSTRAELDFRREAANAERTAANFVANPQVYVPRVLHELSGARVLTLEFIEGCKLTDAEGLARIGLQPRELAHLVSSTFSAMLFTHGFVHCDPHPGNLLARRVRGTQVANGGAGGGAGGGGGSGTAGELQLVILDHGMYRELDPSFRADYSRLWVCLLTRDHEGGRAAAAALGVPTEDYDALSLVLTFRPAASSLAIGARIDAAERRRLRQKYGKLGAKDVNAFLESLPRDMLFAMRMWALVRSLNRALGGTTRQRLLVVAEHAAAGAYSDVDNGWRARAAARWTRLRMRIVVRLIDYAGSALLAIVAQLMAASKWVRSTVHGVAALGRLAAHPTDGDVAGHDAEGANGGASRGDVSHAGGATPVDTLGARLSAPIAGDGRVSQEDRPLRNMG
jgi:aarF domain-containing kinase